MESTISSIFISAGVAFVTALLTNLIHHKYIEYRKNQEKLYAPLYDELVELANNIVSFADFFPQKNWENIKNKHLLFRIKPAKFRWQLQDLYDYHLRNFYPFWRNVQEHIYNIVTKELKISTSDCASEESQYVQHLAKELFCEYNFTSEILYLETRYAKFQLSTKVNYRSAQELINALKPIIQKEHFVIHAQKLRQETLKEVHSVIKKLARKIGHNDRKIKIIS